MHRWLIILTVPSVLVCVHIFPQRVHEHAIRAAKKPQAYWLPTNGQIQNIFRMLWWVVVFLVYYWSQLVVFCSEDKAKVRSCLKAHWTKQSLNLVSILLEPKFLNFESESLHSQVFIYLSVVYLPVNIFAGRDTSARVNPGLHAC